MEHDPESTGLPSLADVAGDPWDFLHGARVGALADALAVRLGWSERRREVLRLGGAVHDIGKVTISPAVLQKTGLLSEAELAEIQRHPSAGVRIVAPFLSLRAALPCILFHHERWDGDGYPTGRRRTAIPLEARLLAVVDAFDAMISDRPYRDALSPEEALDELDEGAGSQFDPALAEAFVVAWHAGALAPERATASPTPRVSTVFA